MKGLLIAFSFFPSKTVGAIRSTYWYNAFLEEGVDQLDVLTSQENVNLKGVISIPLRSKSIFSFFIKDEGLGWIKDLKKYVNSDQITKYDFVIITGGPFFHFGIGNYLKKKGVAKKIILDYRDPFSVNPRFNDGKLKIFIKKYFEKQFLKGVDKILTVNDQCHDLIAPKSKIKRGIVPNGYNEKFLDKSKCELLQKDSFVYPGKFYWQPKAFFEVLTKMDIPIFHAGEKPAFEDTFFNSKNYKFQGYFAQDTLQQFLNLGNIGLVFLNENPFESTTKIYDYIALNLKVLVVTKGQKRVGAMHDILKNYPNVVWANNEREEIEIAINELLTMQVTQFECEPFSRYSGYKLLKREISDLL